MPLHGIASTSHDWAPLGGKGENEWVMLGNATTGPNIINGTNLCRTYEDINGVGKKPLWGKHDVNFGTHALCCLKGPAHNATTLPYLPPPNSTTRIIIDGGVSPKARRYLSSTIDGNTLSLHDKDDGTISNVTVGVPQQPHKQQWVLDFLPQNFSANPLQLSLLEESTPNINFLRRHPLYTSSNFFFSFDFFTHFQKKGVVVGTSCSWHDTPGRTRQDDRPQGKF